MIGQKQIVNNEEKKVCYIVDPVLMIIKFMLLCGISNILLREECNLVFLFVTAIILFCMNLAKI